MDSQEYLESTNLKFLETTIQRKKKEDQPNLNTEFNIDGTYSISQR